MDRRARSGRRPPPPPAPLDAGAQAGRLAAAGYCAYCRHRNTFKSIKQSMVILLHYLIVRKTAPPPVSAVTRDRRQHHAAASNTAAKDDPKDEASVWRPLLAGDQSRQGAFSSVLWRAG